jgi:hypothetical protein
MSLLKSFFAVLFFGFLTVGCGSTSIIQTAVYDEISKIGINIDEGRPEQLYRQELQRIINRNGLQPQQYDLNCTITSSTGNNNMVMSVEFELYDKITGKTILNHGFSSSASIGAVSSSFGSSQAKKHAQERLSLNLAQKTFSHLILFFNKHQSDS